MIVVDQHELNLTRPETDNEIFATTWMKDFKELKGDKGYVIIKDLSPLTKNRLAFKPQRGFDAAGFRQNPKTGVNEHWIYCKDAPIVNAKTGNKYYRKYHPRFFNEMMLTVKKDMELIFCLMNFVDLGQFGFVIEDKVKDAKKKLDTRKAESAVSNWIDNLLKPEEVVKLCYRWGINPTDKSDPELRIELFEKIKSMEQQKDKKRGYQAFINELESNSEIIKIGTYVHKAIQDKKIVKNPSNRTWMWTGTTDVIGSFVPPERWARDPEEYLIEYLNREPKELELFLSGLQIDSGIANLAQEIDDYMMIKHPASLRSWMLKKTGHDIGMIALVDGQAKVKEFLEKNPVTV